MSKIRWAFNTPIIRGRRHSERIYRGRLW